MHSIQLIPGTVYNRQIRSANNARTAEVIKGPSVYR